MAVSLSVVVAKDGAGATIVGGLQAQDKSGVGTGPFTLGHVLIDGLAGTLMAAVTAANALKVDGSAVTQPVSGTFWQATQPVSLATLPVTNAGTFAVQAAQSGTWTVQPGNTANTTAWKVDGSAVTQPVSGSLTTVSTVTNLSQLGGTAIAMNTGVRAAGVQRVTIATDDVVPASQSGTWTVQPGNTANTTAWKVDGSAVTQPVSLASVPSHAVTNAGTFAVQAAEADGANVTLGSKADAKSTATDTTSISVMSVLKQISSSVQAPPSQAVTNAGTFAVQAAITAASGALASGSVASGAFASGAISSGAIAAGAIAAGATSIADNEDVASADGDRGVKVLGVRKATPGNTSGTDGDYEFLQMSAGRVWTDSNIRFAGTTPDLGSGTGGSATQRVIVDSSQFASLQTVSAAMSTGYQLVTLANDQPWGVGASGFTKLEDVASADGDKGVPAMVVRKATPANTSGTDGDYEFLQTSGGKLWTMASGSVATNVAIADNPLNLGVQAVSSENAAVTTARQVQLVADLVGKLIVLPYANPENFVSGAITSAMTGTTTTSLLAAPASGLRNYITQITVSNAHATVGTDIIIQDGSGGTTLYTLPAAAVYGGAVITFPVPLRQPTTATAIFCANVTTGASTKVSASGYKGV